MDPNFLDKTTEYIKKATEFEDKGDYLNAIAVVEELRKYITEIEKKETDEPWMLYYQNYDNIWGLYRRELQVRNDLEVYKKEMNVVIKDLQQKIKELENKR